MDVMTTHPRGADHARMAADDTIRPAGPALDPPARPACDLIDEARLYYTEWRYEAAAAAEVYRRWSTAPAADREHCYAAYIAALDQEEAAATMYAITAAELRALLHRAG